MVEASGHRRRWIWLAGGTVAVALAAVAGPYAYIHVVSGRAPAPLGIASRPGAPGGSPDPAGSGGPGVTGTGAPDGTWSVTSGSTVGYRVKEVLFGQGNVAVGRTGTVTGTLTVAGATVPAAEFTVDMASVRSDQSRRDERFNDQIMETGRYPVATFRLTRPIDLGGRPAPGRDVSTRATGELTMHGVTRGVTFAVTARWDGGAVRAAGQIPIRFADWKIANPSFGPVSTEDNGVLEFALVLTRT